MNSQSGSDRELDPHALRQAAAANARCIETIRGFPRPEGTQIAVNFTADFDAMLLRRLLDEPQLQLAKGEFGGRVGVWRLLELFDRCGVGATLFVPGRICELYPEAVRAWADSGHEIADHMWEHRVPTDPQIERDHLLRATDALERTSGSRPIGTRSWHTPDLLLELGYVYNSHGAADHLPYRTHHSNGSLLNLPFHYALDDAQFFSFTWMNTENSAQRIADPDRVLNMWWNAFLQQYRVGGYVNFCLHPFVSGRALRVAMLEELICRMRELPGVWFATCADVARRYSTIGEG
ncbi:polysaccharide deacetylase family protein [Mycobacterium sp. 21AC1]|uniref:polysaccharide deacetylase family protein n=1 Tax=[Mycobacterium] appelbergii TaxID=2939269 RepID=UPI00293916E3|nr:polysaccharide deacetylase family protein [Mycobacterium sp. 21AC1]MDV3129899.1 polysaccharide deacetylase family protein [Mycobacterium sp. 21AC1]